MKIEHSSKEGFREASWIQTDHKRSLQLVLVCLVLMMSGAAALGQIVGTPGQAGPLPPPPVQGYCLAFSANFAKMGPAGSTYQPLNLSSNGTGSYTWYNPGIWYEHAAPSSNILVTTDVPPGGTATQALELLWTKGQTPAGDTTISTTATNGSYYSGWHYGYFEVRMAWDPVVGAWPALWMQPIQNILTPGVEQGELDIFEGQGATPNFFYGTIHDWLNGVSVASNSPNNYRLAPGVNVAQFHNYGVLWVPGQVTWYFDNWPVHSVATYPIFDNTSQLYYLMLGSQEGANWIYGNTSGVSATSIPMYVQWVHVWQKGNGCTEQIN